MARRGSPSLVESVDNRTVATCLVTLASGQRMNGVGDRSILAALTSLTANCPCTIRWHYDQAQPVHKPGSTSQSGRLSAQSTSSGNHTSSSLASSSSMPTMSSSSLSNAFVDDASVHNTVPRYQAQESKMLLEPPFSRTHVQEVRVLMKDLSAHLCNYIRESDGVFGCMAWLTDDRVLTELASDPHRNVSMVLQKESYLRGGKKYHDPFHSRLRRRYEAIPALDCTSVQFTPPKGFVSSSRDISASSSHNTVPEVSSSWNTSVPGSRGTVPEKVTDKTQTLDMVGFAQSMSVRRLDAVRCFGLSRSKGENEHSRIYMHHKFYVFCKRQAVKGKPTVLEPFAVWTGSANSSGTSRSNEENVVVLVDAACAHHYLAEWFRLFQRSQPCRWRSGDCVPEFECLDRKDTKSVAMDLDTSP